MAIVTLRFLTAGESHGPELMVIIEGMPAGVPISPEDLDQDLSRRLQGYGRGARSTRIERDRAEIVAGVAGGATTGAPIGVLIINRDFANQPTDPQPLTTPRPGHVDLVGRIKYGLGDFRLARERASARETAARVVAGGAAKLVLRPFGARVGSFVLSVGQVEYAVGDGPLWPGTLADPDLEALAQLAEDDPMRCPDPEASQRMREEVDRARAAGETLGGVFCVVASGVPPGLGSYVQWDRKLDGQLAQALASIHAVKGVQLGAAFALARARGSEAQDPIVLQDGAIARTSNHAGGLEAGVTNGKPVLLIAAMKPLSSIRAPIPSVDFVTSAPADPPYVRSDVCSVPAAAVVGEAMVAWVLASALLERYGADRLDAMIESHRSLMDAGNPSVTGPTSGGEGGR
jgi:chorismate synthase